MDLFAFFLLYTFYRLDVCLTCPLCDSEHEREQEQKEIGSKGQ